MITLQPAVSPNPAGNGVNTANAAHAGASSDERGGAAADGPDFAALMAGMLADSSPGAAAGVNDANKDTSEGKKGAAGGDAGAVEAQAADAALGRDAQPAGAGIGLAAQIEGAIALEYAIASPAPAAVRAHAVPEGRSGATPAAGRNLNIAPDGAAAQAPDAHGPGEELHAAELPGKPGAAAPAAPRHPAMAFDGSAPGAVPVSEIPALSSPATGDAQAARHMEFQALQLQSRASEQATPAAAHAARLDAPLGSSRWREDLAAHISVMVRDTITRAEIRVAPPELGPIHARISLDGGVATVSFSAPAPETRDALEAALATLRERLAESGIALGETSVSDDRGARFEDRAPPPDRQAARSGERAEGSDDPAERDAPGRMARIEGLVDLYA